MNEQQRRSTTTLTSVPVVDPVPSRQDPPCPQEPVVRVRIQPAEESPKIPSRPTTAPRAKSQPLPPLTIPSRKPMKEITPSMGPEHGVRSNDLPATEICVSPSWSDFGNSKKKKEKKRLEREKKEQEKKAKKLEKDEQAAAKAAGKRLSKRPPPAAMETQRMPAALRSSKSPPPNLTATATATATSKENSRLSSGRSSFTDHDPNVETANRPSSRHSFRSFFTAPQLPKIFQGTRSRSGSNSSQNTFAEGERQYLKELIGYADEQDTSDVEAKPQPLKPRARKVSFSPETDDMTPTIPLNSKVELPWMASESQRGSNSSSSSLVLRSKREGEYRHPSSTKVGSDRGMHQDEETVAAVSDTPKAPPIVSKPEQKDAARGERGILDMVEPSQVVPTSDGSSYVQKHRMHQQQRSIAGYEDELALGRFNDLTAAQMIMELERQRLPPTPSGSFESLHRTKRLQGPYDCNGEDLQRCTLKKLKADEYLSLLSEPPLRPASLDRKAPPSPKIEGTAGLPRRPKFTSPSMSATSSNTITKNSDPARSPIRPVSPPSPVSPETIALISSISNAEGGLGTRWSPPSPPPKSTNRSSHQSSNNRVIETLQQPLSEASTASFKTEENLKSQRISSPGLTLNGPQTLSKISTTQDLSQITDDSLSSYSWRALDNANRPSSSRGSTSSSTVSSLDFVPTPQLSISKPVPEVVIEGIDGDGMTRRMSIKRPRSQPQLQDPATTTPDLSFLPEPKHQTLVKPDRKSPTASLASSRSSFGGPPSSSDKHSLHSSPQFSTPSPPSTRPSSDDGNSLPVGASSLNYTPKAAFRSPDHNHPAPGSGSLLRPGSAPRRSTMTVPSSVGGPGTGSAAAATQIKPLAKMFVICCKCKFWHDLPSALYKEMAMSREIVVDEHEHEHDPEGLGFRPRDLNPKSESERRGSTGKVHGRIETSVQCPWCQHGMSTNCCAGWSCVVYLHERHH